MSTVQVSSGNLPVSPEIDSIGAYWRNGGKKSFTDKLKGLERYMSYRNYLKLIGMRPNWNSGGGAV